MDRNTGEILIRVGLNVAYYRKLRNWNQEELSERAKLSRTLISNIEAPNMFTNPTLSTLINIAKALQIPPAKLLEIKDENF